MVWVASRAFPIVSPQQIRPGLRHPGQPPSSFRPKHGPEQPLNATPSTAQLRAQVRCKGTPPSPRYNHTGTLVANRLVLFGGLGPEGALRDLHALDTASHTWSARVELELRGV